MPDRKINFCSKFAIQTLRATVANADTGSLKSLHALFDTYFDNKFKQNRLIQNLPNGTQTDILNLFYKALTPFLQLKQLFGGKLLFFSVPKLKLHYPRRVKSCTKHGRLGQFETLSQ